MLPIASPTNLATSDGTSGELLLHLDMIDDLIEKHEIANGNYSSLFDRVEDYFAA